ncbi:hypothetical protein protein [Bacillus cereus G9241]|nr:hypothetical protein protein [Bacillus cereus G9241]
MLLFISYLKFSPNMLNNEIENHMDLKEKMVVLFGKGGFL